MYVSNSVAIPSAIAFFFAAYDATAPSPANIDIGGRILLKSSPDVDKAPIASAFERNVRVLTASIPYLSAIASTSCPNFSATNASQSGCASGAL